MKILVTGGCGFLGTNLSSEAVRRGYAVVIADNLSHPGSVRNLQTLQRNLKAPFVHLDVRSFDNVERVVRNEKPDFILHLAGQIAMTKSIDDPRSDFEINVIGGHNLLEAVRRHVPHCHLFYSSTNKVYGDLSDVQLVEQATRYSSVEFPSGFNESLRLDFRSPYGCSKGAIDQYMLDYHRMYGIKTTVFRHSSVFGIWQQGTFDQGWVAWFLQQAIRTKEDRSHRFTISGDGKQVRDVLFSDDLVECYYKAIAAGDKVAGQVFNIGGGINNSLSLIELLSELSYLLKIDFNVDFLPWRLSDQKFFVADTTKASAYFNWSARVGKLEGIRQSLDWTERGFD